MLGTIVNSLAIIIGSIMGFLIKGGIPEKLNDTIIKGLSLCILVIGISGAMDISKIPALMAICSISIGALIGELIDINKRLENLGLDIEKKLKGRGGRVSEGFVSASLIYCVGAMAIVGSLDSGLKGDYRILFSKATIDGISAIMFTSTMGIGVLLSSVSVFIYQGIITIGAIYIQGLLTPDVVINMSVVGSILIIGLALNMLGAVKIKVANLLPAIFIPLLYEIGVKIFYLAAPLIHQLL